MKCDRTHGLKSLNELDGDIKKRVKKKLPDIGGADDVVEDGDGDGGDEDVVEVGAGDQ